MWLIMYKYPGVRRTPFSCLLSLATSGGDTIQECVKIEDIDNLVSLHTSLYVL